MIEKLTQNTINGLRSEYVYGINTSILNTCMTLYFSLWIVLYMSTKRLATTIRLSVGTSQDEIVIEESVDQIVLTSEMKDIYSSLSHILLISIRCRDDQGIIEHVCFSIPIQTVVNRQLYVDVISWKVDFVQTK